MKVTPPVLTWLPRSDQTIYLWMYGNNVSLNNWQMERSRQRTEDHGMIIYNIITSVRDHETRCQFEIIKAIYWL